MNVIKIKTLHFEIKEDHTRLYIEISSNEPDHLVWGNGVKYKDFPPYTPIVEIIQKAISDRPIEEILSWKWATYIPFKPSFGWDHFCVDNIAAICREPMPTGEGFDGWIKGPLMWTCRFKHKFPVMAVVDGEELRYGGL